MHRKRWVLPPFRSAPTQVPTSGPYTFQVVLYPSGKMKFQYQTLGPGTTSATAGIQNDSRTDGLTVNFNQPYAHNGLAVEIVSGPSWLTVEPANLVVKPGEARRLPWAVTEFAIGMAEG